MLHPIWGHNSTDQSATESYKISKSNLAFEKNVVSTIFRINLLVNVTPSKVYGQNISCAMNACIWVFKLKLSNLD